ncbi:MAG: uroporphyrinogen decarboxylase/cobalamine-independent methonine synthase family protein, partial [Planctomycetota bacterium]
MNERERYIATLLFERPDRVTFDPGNGRESTLAAWRTQGLPPEVEDYHGYVREFLGIPQEAAPRPDRIDPGMNLRMIPEFDEKVIEKREHSLIVQDWKGNICEISDEYDIRYLRNPIDFVTRRWVKCPVESREDWEGMKERYNADDPRRFPEDFVERVRKLEGRDYPSCIWDFPGPFWQMREWLGFEGLCMKFIDDAEMIQDMVDFWGDFVYRVTERMFETYVPDLIMVSEDMAYKMKSMISPAMARQYLLPVWKKWGELCKRANLPIYAIDSDGYTGDLMDLWIEAGFICNFPMEVAA